MRDPERIVPMMNEIAEIWKKNAPNMRFGQFMTNVLEEIYNYYHIDPFFVEDENILEYIKGIAWLQK